MEPLSTLLSASSGISSQFATNATHFEFSETLDCFFFIANSNLYRVSRTDLLAIDTLDLTNNIFQVVCVGKTLTELLNSPVNRQLTKEEELLRERQRGASSSAVISSFILSNGEDQVLIPALGTLFVLSFSLQSEAVGVKHLASQNDVGAARMDVQWAPDDKWLSFVRKNNLWLVEVATGHEVRKTDFSDSPDSTTSITGDFVMQEEFDRFSAVFWAPANTSRAGQYRLAFFEVDVSPVTLLTLPTSAFADTEPEAHRFARAGKKNAIEKLHVLDLDANTGATVASYEPSEPLTVPEEKGKFEYSVRCNWSADGEIIFVQLLDREQKKLNLVQAAVQPRQPLAFQTRYLFESSYWINLSDIFYSLLDGRLLVSTETVNNFRHLYLLDANKTLHPVTAGSDWLVDNTCAVDEDAQLIYFTSSKDSPIQVHLYKVGYDKNETPVTRLTDLNYSYTSITVGIPKAGEFVATYSYSNHKTPPELGVLSATTKGCFVKAKAELKVPFPITPPEIFTFKNSLNKTSYGYVFRPRSKPRSTANNEESKFPTVLYVYGGPHVQLVTDDFAGVMRFSKFQAWMELGLQVVIIDGPGSWRRGLEWEGVLLHAMGQVELADQVKGLSSLESVDMQRVCVTGWSYGGYLSLQALLQFPDVFKFAVCGAPVTFWEAYDTGYTERYMGLPQTHQSAYDDASVVKRAAKFPEAEGRLVLLHGLKDENVHFTHTSELIRALCKARRPYALQIFPDERHGIRNFESWVYNETQFFSALLTKL